jgi:hypothetical protein
MLLPVYPRENYTGEKWEKKGAGEHLLAVEMTLLAIEISPFVEIVREPGPSSEIDEF